MIPAGLPSSWGSTAFGPARWARSIETLVDYLRPRYPTLAFLGGLGDQTHVTEGNTSAHNPITKDPVSGVGIVLAVDLGVTDGNYAPLLEIRQLIYSHPNDPRMAGGVSPKGSGYLSGPDDKANNWPIGSGWNGGNKDIGHLHVNVAAAYFPFRPDGYLPSMDLTTPWDFMSAPLGDDMAWSDQQVADVIAAETFNKQYVQAINGKVDDIGAGIVNLANYLAALPATVAAAVVAAQTGAPAGAPAGPPLTAEQIAATVRAAIASAPLTFTGSAS